mgnify:CR=1 FL=1
MRYSTIFGDFYFGKHANRRQAKAEIHRYVVREAVVLGTTLLALALFIFNAVMILG